MQNGLTQTKQSPANLGDDSDRRIVLRARKLERYLSQPFFVTAEHSGIPGASVALPETLADCAAFLSGALDHLAEDQCYMRGSLREYRNA